MILQYVKNIQKNLNLRNCQLILKKITNKQQSFKISTIRNITQSKCRSEHYKFQIQQFLMYFNLLSKYAFCRPSQGKRLINMIKGLLPNTSIKSKQENTPNKNFQSHVKDDYLSFDKIIKLDPQRIISLSKMEILTKLSQKGRPILVLSSVGKNVVQGEQQIIETLRNLDKSLDQIINTKGSRLTQKQIQLLKTHKKILKTRQAQLLLTLYLVQNQYLGQSLKKSYETISQPLEKFAISYEQIKNGINLPMLQIFIPKEIEYLKEYEDNLSAIRNHLTDKQFSEFKLQYLFNDCQISIYKIDLIIQFHPYACRTPLDDLFSENPQTSERWKALEPFITKKLLGDRQEVANSFEDFKNSITRMFAIASTLDEVLLNPYSIKSTFNSFFRGDVLEVLEYVVDMKKAERRAKLFKLNPSKQLLTLIFNADTSIISKLAIGFGLPSIRYSEVLYLPRHFPKITIELVSDWVKNNNYGILKSPLKLPQHQISDQKAYTQKLFDTKYDEDENVMIRINSSFNLQSSYSSTATAIKEVTQSILGSKDDETIVDSVIFQIHGGGFICQNSYIHQMYLRPIAKNLKVPIISVDYRLSPEYKYPQALDDCFQAYMWVVEYFNKVFKNTGKDIKILVTGDSAGGNLSAALTGLAIKLGIKIPDALLLIYPALNLSVKRVTPSQFTSVDDFLLPLSVLQICREAYIDQTKSNPEKDPFLSPTLFSNEILQHFPSTKIFVGDKDSLSDDSYRLTQRLKQNNVNVHLTVYEQFPHGFIQYDNPVKQTKYCRFALQDIQNGMKQLLGKTNK